MPILNDTQMSEAALRTITNVVGSGIINSIDYDIDRGQVTYTVRYTDRRGSNQQFFYRESQSELESSENSATSNTIFISNGSARFIENGVGYLRWPESTDYFYVDAPTTNPIEQIKLDFMASTIEESKKEQEQFMIEMKLNPSKTFRNYLTVTYNPEWEGRDLFFIKIHDLMTGEVLAENVVKMSIKNFNDFAAYAESFYNDICPILVKDVPKPHKHREYVVNKDILNQIKVNTAQYKNNIEELRKNTISRIRSSNPDGLEYWVDLQVSFYRYQIAGAGVKKFLDDLSKLGESGEIDVSVAALYCHNCFNLNPSNKIMTRTQKLHYRLSDMLHTESDVNIGAIKYPGINTQAFYKDTIKFIVKKKVSGKVKKLTYDQLMPRLSGLRNELNQLIRSLYNYPNSEITFFAKVAHNEIFWHLCQSTINRSAFQKVFTHFNELKNSYMLMGQSEEEATVTALKQDEILSSDKRCQEFGYCLVTKQYLPKLFLTNFKEGYISTYYAYMHSYLNSPDGSTFKYNVDEYKNNYIIENIINGRNEYAMTVYGYRRNVMEFLTVRKLPKENTTITNDECLFTPTPFLGIELEVEQQAAVKYMINGREKFAPDDITNQCYDALGRDYVIFKRDGSLRGDNPFEIVTVPATLSYHQDRWKSFLDNKELKKYLTSYSSGNCGMHVHINRDSFTGLHLAKFMRFINCSENFEFITSVAQRSHSRYAQFLTEARTGGFARYFRGNPDLRGEKYSAVNTLPSSTVEVRIFRGNLAKVGFLKNLEFVHAAWQFTKDAPLTALTFNEFIFWLFNPSNNTKEYKHLKMWLLAYGWNVDGVTVKKTDTGILRQRKEERRAQVMKAREKIRKQFTEPKDKAPPPISKDEIISAA